MFLASNLRRLQNIYRIVAVVLLIAYPINYFWLDQGSIVAFAVTYLSCFIIPTWYSWKLVDKWSNSKPLIGENVRITANLAKGYAENVRVESTSKVPTTEVDDGRNRANVEAVQTFLETAFQPTD